MYNLGNETATIDGGQRLVMVGGVSLIKGCAMFLLLTLAAAATVQAPAAPSGPWEVNVQENMCLLKRSYPVDKGKTSLIFQPLLDLPDMEMYVASPGGSPGQYTGKYKVQVEPGGRTFTGRYYSVRTNGQRFTRLFIDRAVLDGLQNGDVMSIEAKPVNGSFRIARPEIARPALATCINDLKKSWGVNPEEEGRAVTSLEGDPGRYFNEDSYPKEAWSKGIYGRVVALLNISANGTVEKCHIVSSAGTALNEGTCAAVRNARFKPPRDADGHALATTYLLPVRWVLPGTPD